MIKYILNYRAQYLFLALSLLMSAFIKPWATDEGWNLLMAQFYLDKGYFLEFSYNQNLVFLKSWLYLLSQLLLIFDPKSYYVFRFPGLLLSLLSLLFFYKALLALKVSLPRLFCCNFICWSLASENRIKLFWCFCAS